jgi:hypothetical protein
VQVNDVKIRDSAIPVDLVLDIGNSRSCGILIEEHRDDKKVCRSFISCSFAI